MPWEFDNSKPIYVQLVERLKLMIISGQLKQGQKLNSVRELAEEAGVNPNTMQRALAELERGNLVYTKRTSGRFVTEDVEEIKVMKDQYAAEKIDELVQALLKLGFNREDIMALIKQHI